MKTKTLTLACLLTAAPLLGGCGLEELIIGAVVGEPETPIPGSIPDGAAQLSGELDGVAGAVELSLYTAGGVPIEPLSLNVDYSANPVRWSAVLPVDQHHFNIRVVAQSGGVLRKLIIAEPYSDGVTSVEPIDAVSTTLALALELKTVEAVEAATPTPSEETPTATPTEAAPRAQAQGDGLPHLGALPCDGVDVFKETLLGQIAAGSGPAAELLAAVSDEIASGATSWPAVVTSPDDLEEPIASLAEAAAASAPADGELAPDHIRVLLGVVRIQGYPDAACQGVDIDKWVNPSSGDRMFLTGGIHEDSPIQDANIQNEVFPNWVPNILPMWDDGTHGDPVAGDDIWVVAFNLPKTMRIGYKYTFGLQGENWTGTEEWPGNQRILEIEDVNGDGYVARFDVFADEKSNKDKSNLYIFPGVSIGWDTDLNGDGYLEAREQPADFIGGDCVKDGWWEPLSLPPVTVDGCF